MESKFNMKLKEDLPAFSKFVEICERRNLLTHTGGVASAQYLATCRAHKALLPNIEPGTKLTVDNKYYSAAVDTVCEIGIKLCYVLWRKFAKDERDSADLEVNEFCYDLIVNRNYEVAEAILSFTTQVLKRGGNDYRRRMMVINQANAVRLQKREGDANRLLDTEDWSAVKDDIAVSVAAVRGDVDRLVALMEKIGPNGRPNAEDYRTWPVFRGLRSNARFKEKFQSVFGESVILPKEVEIEVMPVGIEEPQIPKNKMN